MKLLSVGLARAVWLFDTGELNPGGKNIFTYLVPAFVEDYKFKTFTKQGDDLKDGIKLVNGQFVKSNGDVILLNVTVFSDGITADTFSSTADSESFLNSALNELPSVGFAFESEMVRRKNYLSQLSVKCSKPLHNLNPGLIEFASSISSAMGEPFHFAAMEFWPELGRAIKAAGFSFQQKIGEPADGNRYWSQAGLPTDKHLALLEELETLLSR